jgi:hypothetical protein
VQTNGAMAGRRRGLVLGAVATMLVATGLVLGASPASAHHPEITADASCAQGGGFLIDYTATAWLDADPLARTHTNVQITATVNGVTSSVGSGEFNAGNGFSFSGQFTVPDTATSVVVTATSIGPWGNGFGGDESRSTPPLTLPTDCTPPGAEGCTPGYWKNHLSAWEGYTPGQTVGSVFTGTGDYGLSTSTLQQALQFGGGSNLTGAAKILLRAGVAALLNASSSGVDSPHTTAEVIATVDAALASADRDTILEVASALDDDNNLGCPL